MVWLDFLYFFLSFVLPSSYSLSFYVFVSAAFSVYILSSLYSCLYSSVSLPPLIILPPFLSLRSPVFPLLPLIMLFLLSSLSPLSLSPFRLVVIFLFFCRSPFLSFILFVYLVLLNVFCRFFFSSFHVVFYGRFFCLTS